MTFRHAIKLLISTDPKSREWGKKLFAYNYKKLKYANNGKRENFLTFNEWVAYHELHGKVYRDQDGHTCCEGCGAEN